MDKLTVQSNVSRILSTLGDSPDSLSLAAVANEDGFLLLASCFC